MPYETGGRADKEGNRYEIKYFVYKIMELIEEKIDYLTIEAIGEDEQGVDIWVGKKDGTKEGQQCKGRNGSEDSWNFGTANSKNIFNNWKKHLDKDSESTVSLVTPLAFHDLEDTIKRVKNSNENPNDFYNHQINKSNKKFQNFYSNFCRKMSLDINEEEDIKRSIYYLKRILFHQVPDSFLSEMIFQKISYLFYGNEKEIYNNLISLIVDGDILGKKIDLGFIHSHIKVNNLQLKNLSLDTRISPRIEQLNWEFKSDFQLLNKTFLERKEFKEVYKLINKNESFIIHGKAGIGKTGTTEAIIKYCELNEISYLAIKLDKRTPNHNAKTWGKELGLPDSIANCLHSVSKDKKAVLILDQLDALRWTLAHSRNALLVCSEIIQQISHLNIERDNKISIVMVCRTIDLESDNNIRNLFNIESDSKFSTKWHKIKINELEDFEVENTIGRERYKNLTFKLKKMLKIISNLLIWCRLDVNKNYNECLSAIHLIETWWNQLSANYSLQGGSQKELENFKIDLLNKFVELERIYLPKRLFRTNQKETDFLYSNGFINVSENKISFSHQSILDYLLSEKMLDQYFEGLPIVEILGRKQSQTPGKRYQLQMAMQYLLEFESKDFIKVGTEILNNSEIRYFNKYAFLEILRDSEILDAEIEGFIVSYCENIKWKKHLLQNVIFSKHSYYKLLLANGIIEKWLDSEEDAENAIILMSSVRPNYDLEDINLIHKYILSDKKKSNSFIKFLSPDFNQDTNEMFDLRMSFYNDNPHMLRAYLDVNDSLKTNEYRTVRYLALLMELNFKKNDNQNNFIDRKVFLKDEVFTINDGERAFSILSKYLPSSTDSINDFSLWSAVHYKDSLERVVVDILKKSISSLILSDFERFKNIILCLSRDSNDVINELILESLSNLSKEHSNYVVKFICENFEKRIFIKSNGSKDVLSLIKKCLSSHTLTCNDQLFIELEDRISTYMPKGAKDYIKYRYEYNKNDNKGEKVFWSFWGDLQVELLSVLPKERLSQKSIELLNILQRKFNGKSNRYRYFIGSSGFVASPIDGKNISYNSWKGILNTNKKEFSIGNRWKSLGGSIIEGTIQQFANSFSREVSRNPKKMITLVLHNKKEVEIEFIDALYSGLAFIDLTNIPNDLLEMLFEKFSHRINSFQAQNICRVIKNKKNVKWSKKTLNLLIKISSSHFNLKTEENTDINMMNSKDLSFDKLYTDSLNSAEGCAARTIGNLILEDPNYYKIFKNSIVKLTNHQNLSVNLATMFTLRVLINIDTEFALNLILKLYRKDYRLAGYLNIRNMLFHAYEVNPNLISKTILMCFNSQDKDLIRVGSFTIGEMYLTKKLFKNEIDNIKKFNEYQVKYILEVFVNYFDEDKYNEICKENLLHFIDSNYDLEIIFSSLFHEKIINLNRDYKFLTLIMNSKISKKILHSFVKFLEEKNNSLIEYSGIILMLCENTIKEYNHSNKNYFGIEEELSKLIIGLYDETSKNSKLSNIANKSLELWDKMFESRIGSIRELSKEIMIR